MNYYNYEVFKACNNKNKKYGCAECTITNVDLKSGVCTLLYYEDNGTGRCVPKPHNEYVETVVERYIKSTFTLPYITNPSKLKTWKGFRTFTFESVPKEDVAYMLLGVKEQYNDITKAMRADKMGLSYKLEVLPNGDVQLSGMMKRDIPFKVKVFYNKNKTLAELKSEIVCYLFDTLDGIANL